MSSFPPQDHPSVLAKREYPERPIVGVGGVVLSNGRALLIKRGAPPLAGQWSIPGGMLELGETLVEGVQRELAEETGLAIRVLELVEVFERIELDAAGRALYHFVVLDYLCEVIGGEARAGSDVSEAAWAAPSEFPSYGLTETATRVIEKALKIRERTPPDPSR